MIQVLVTCEHACNRVPKEFKDLFRLEKELLESHRGYDVGALALARAITKSCALYQAKLIQGSISRLVIDLNRSLGNRHLYSRMIKSLPLSVRDDILEKYYFPYRDAVFQAIEERIAAFPVVHLSIHSFTPVLHGIKRKADVGLLYDPARAGEVCVCRALRARFHQLSSKCCLMNSPYRGISDGLVTSLRRLFPAERYVGIEIEMNQKFNFEDKGEYKTNFLRPFLKSLDFALKEYNDRSCVS